MPSTSGFSDVIQLERIIAHGEWYYGRYDSPAPSSKNETSFKDLNAIGAHFQLNPKQGSWPKSLEITDDEGTSQGSDATTPKPPKNTRYPPPSYNDDHPKSPPPAPRLTPPQAIAYLNSTEFSELQRQRLNNHEMRSEFGQLSEASPTPLRGPSTCTTVDGADDERAPDHQGQHRTPASVGHTPSHRSFSTTEDEPEYIREPTSPRPWSPYDQKSSNNKDKTKE